MSLKRLSLISALVLTSSLAVATALPAKDFNSEKLQEIDVAISQAIERGSTPGGIFWLEQGAKIHHRVYGRRAIVPRDEPATLDTIYDLASLTKVVATAPAIMILVERGRIRIDDPVSKYLHEFQGRQGDAITLRHLLTHTSGLRPSLAGNGWTGYESGIGLALKEQPLNRPGVIFRYSDINFILLGEIVRRVTGESLDRFTSREIYRPLQMRDTGFNPPDSRRGRIAPTEQTSEGMLRGRVHDPTARLMGGVAGHAGLFSTARDLSRYFRMIASGGELEGVRILSADAVHLMTSVQGSSELRRGLGWDIDSSYSRPRGSLFPLGSFGHTGWTGSFVWIDPFSRSFYFFLSNRVHPDGKGRVLELQKRLGTLAAEAIQSFDWSDVAGALPRRPGSPRELAAGGIDTLNGIDVLTRDNFSVMKGLRIGLITNQTGRDRSGNPTIDLLGSTPQLTLVALFSPEHGIRGDIDARVSDSLDARSGLPIQSLYGASRKPTPAQLANLDALVFDIQDVGVRFYTYISTMKLAMEAASESGKKFFVLDRINPINGTSIEGPASLEERTFVVPHPIAVRHGMTIGELARMFREEGKLDLDLTVVPLEKWSRKLWQDQTSLAWVNPSPNMRSLAAATLYPGIGLLENGALSVGRGTGSPFEWIGAPYIDGPALAAALSGRIAGLRFTPESRTPSSSKFEGQICGGVRIGIEDREKLEPVAAGLLIARTLFQLYGEKSDLDAVNRLLQHNQSIRDIREGKDVAQVEEGWASELEAFRVRRARFLLYE